MVEPRHVTEAAAAVAPKSARRRPRSVHLTERDVNPTETARFFTAPRLLQEEGLKEPYRQHSWTYAAIHALACNISQVPFRILTGDENNPRVIREGPWVELFDRVNPFMEARAQLWEAIVIWLSHPNAGEVAIVKESRGDHPLKPNEIPFELWPMNGKLLQPKINKETKLVDYWEQKGPDGKPIRWENHQIARIKYYNPYDPLRGLAPGDAAERATRVDNKAEEFNEAYLDNDAEAGGYLLTDGELTPEQEKDIRRNHEDRHQGRRKRRRVGVLSGGMKWQSLGSSLRDMEFGSMLKLKREQILSIYKVPESEVSILSNMNFATAMSSDRGFWTKTLIPIMKLIEDSLWVQLFNVRRPSLLRAAVDRRNVRFLSHPLYKVMESRVDPPTDEDKQGQRGLGDVWGEFDLTSIEALRHNLDVKLTSAQRMLALGYTLNQVNERLELGMNQVPWGNTAFAPPNAVPIDQLFLPDEDPNDISGQPTGDGTPKPPPPEPGDEPAAEEEPFGDPDEQKGFTLDIEPPEARTEDQAAREQAKRAIDRMIKRRGRAVNDRKMLFWRNFIKRDVDPLERRFRGRYRRFLIQLRSASLRALRDAIAKKEGTPTGLPQPNRPPGVKLTTEQLRQATPLDPTDVDGALFDQEFWANRAKAEHHPLYVEATVKGADAALNEIGGNFVFDVTDPRVVDVINQREEILANTTQTIRRRLARTIEAGIQNGESLTEISNRIRSDFNAFGGSRSLTVARTEVASTINETRFMAMEAEGVQEHEWITAGDEAVRDSHDAQDGQAVPIGTPFKNGLLFPNDPSGPAREVINCRCVAVPVV